MADDNVAPAGPVDIEDAYRTFTDVWSPRIVAQVNDYDVKIARVEGDYVWHAHADTDEFFLVLDGELTIEMAGHDPVRLGALQMFTVPRGVRHRPSAVAGTRLLLLEPRGTLNSGDADLSRDGWVPHTTGVPLTPDVPSA